MAAAVSLCSKWQNTIVGQLRHVKAASALVHTLNSSWFYFIFKDDFGLHQSASAGDSRQISASWCVNLLEANSLRPLWLQQFKDGIWTQWDVVVCSGNRTQLQTHVVSGQWQRRGGAADEDDRTMMVDTGKRKGGRQIELDDMTRNELDKEGAEVLKTVLFGKFSLTKAAVWDSSSGLILKYSVIKKKRKTIISFQNWQWLCKLCSVSPPSQLKSVIGVSLRA